MTSPPRNDPSDQDPSPLGSTLVFGVLGGIASGKSRVAQLLAGAEGLVIEADALAHAALEHPEVLAKIVAEHGNGILGEDGKVDRKALGARIFDDPASRQRLEAWIHPLVRERIRSDLDGARSSCVPRVVLDVPLLLENEAEHGLSRLCDHLVYVEVSDAERERRAILSRDWAPGEVARREAAQWPLARKRDAARFIIPNAGSLEELESAVDALLATVLADG